MKESPDNWEAEARVRTLRAPGAGFEAEVGKEMFVSEDHGSKWAGPSEDAVYNLYISPEQLEKMKQGTSAFMPKPDISTTLAERGGRYGQFIDHATIAQGLQDVLRKAENWDKLEPDMKQALTVIADKMARILNGDPYYEDNWHDIIGYSKLVEDRLYKMREGQ